MGTLKILFFAFFCGNGLLPKAAIDTTLHPKLIKTITGNFTDVGVDNLGNTYVITSTNQIKKLGAAFDSIGVFNDIKRYGTIYTIDVSNPLKVLVYYKDFATVVVLDRQLNIRNTIDLRRQNILQVNTIAQSYDNNIWLFDEVEFKLKKMDENGKVLFETADFRLLFDEVAAPSAIIDMNGLLYLYNASKGWTVFDYYGALKNQYPLKNWKDVQVNDNFLKGRDSIYLYATDPKKQIFTKQHVGIDFTQAVKVITVQNLCYVLSKNGLSIYKMMEGQKVTP